ncbi:methionyl-tRNA formyltransferase [Pollutimonas harenae]|uniref:Methionyl-tRNA formyltransferase n=1 Tax=Pollutimonas harenae TaxID=657015 RepID=A0A853GVX2_9BURK|nr:methionyl-tRNA formyltransferase [Pollutimonas harenae]NYT84916.1 methionyl-tRNA formyltransferase [Pollutimonas harenae]TEA72689.1 methionyl-tRNA formyltransferase [Pollutimonas harenae]
MRIVFAGTPEFASQALAAILAAGHEVPLVLTQPDRPSGRGLKLTPSAVKQTALTAGIPVCQPRSLRLDGKYPDEARAAQQALQAAAPDLMVVAAYGLILPEWVLTLPTHGCFNIHASLLPRWRGAAPIQRAIEAGDAQTGVTIMQMDQGLDTGDMLLMHVTPITDEQNASALHDVLAVIGAQAILEAIDALQQGTLRAQPQPEEGVTYAAKLDKSESPLDFSQPAVVLARRIRAFNPVPGSTMVLPGLKDPVKVWNATALPPTATGLQPGQVLQANAQGIDIVTTDGILHLLELQKAGGKRQPVSVFVQGWQDR